MDLASLLDELMQWLLQDENDLTTLEAEPLPDDIPAIEGLIVLAHYLREKKVKNWVIFME